MTSISLRKFRVLIGSLVLASHFICIGLILAFTLGVYDIREVLTFISAIGPITGLYGFTYYRYIVFAVEKLETETGKFIGPASWVTQSLIIGLFCVTVIAAPIYFFTDGVESDLPALLAVVETIFGVYLAKSFSTLFPPEVLGGDTPAQQPAGEDVGVQP